jgi:hypothetical protein
MRLNNTFSITLVLGIISLSACQENTLLPTAETAREVNSPTAKILLPPMQITDAGELAKLKSLFENRDSRLKKGAQTQGVGNATGYLSNIDLKPNGLGGRNLEFTGTVMGVVASDMVVAGLRAFVTFEDATPNAISTWEYSAAYANNGGFTEMDMTEKTYGSCTRVAAALPVPSNARIAYISLYVWDRTDPTTHHKFLAWYPVYI